MLDDGPTKTEREYKNEQEVIKTLLKIVNYQKIVSEDKA